MARLTTRRLGVAPCCDFLQEICECGPDDLCAPGFGCSVANTCVDCAFNLGVTGCSCSLGGECEGESVCVDGTCAT